MVRACCAWYCANHDTPDFRDPPLNIRFFQFPKNNEYLRKKWTMAVSSGRRDGFVPNENTILCSIHFEASDFAEYGDRHVLRPQAVPSLFFVPNSREERKMMYQKSLYVQNPEKKPLASRLDKLEPRRLRKIYVDESSSIDSNGRFQKSFSYFVLPFSMAGDAPWTPTFDFDESSSLAQTQSKPPLQTLALVDKSKDAGSSSVIYLTKADPPPFAHRLTGPGVVSKPEKPKSSIEIVQDPKSQQMTVRWKSSEEEPEESSAAAAATTPFKISNVVSLAEGDDENDIESIIEVGDDSNVLDNAEKTKDSDGSVMPKLQMPKTYLTSTAESEQSYRDKAEQFWRRNCSASQEELSWAHEYEDSDIPSTSGSNILSGCKVLYGQCKKLAAAEKRRAKRKLENDEALYMETFPFLKKARVHIEKLEYKVGAPTASFLRDSSLRPKQKQNAIVPTKTFFYEKPQDGGSLSNLPMKPVRVNYVSPIIYPPNKPKKATGKAGKGYPVVMPVTNLGIYSKMVGSERKQMTFLRKVIGHEHNYYSKETYYDDQGNVVKNDPRIASLSEKVLKLRSILKYERTKLRRLVQVSEKRIKYAQVHGEAKRRESRYDVIKTLNIHPVVKDFIFSEIMIAERNGPKNMNRYTDAMKEFCHELYKISPRAYNFIDGFFHFPHRSKIRQYQPNPFAVSTLVPRPRPPKRVKKPRPESPTPPTFIPSNIVTEDGVELPTVPLPMDLEENDMMYGLEPDEADMMYGGAAGTNDADDDYDDLVLDNPPLVEQRLSKPVHPIRGVVETPTATPTKRRAASSRKPKKRKIEEEEEDVEDEEDSHSHSHVGFGDQSWMRSQPQQLIGRKVVQQQFASQQQLQQQQHQIVYNLYSNPQPGTSSGASTSTAAASMPDIYLGHDALKSFDAYYF